MMQLDHTQHQHESRITTCNLTCATSESRHRAVQVFGVSGFMYSWLMRGELGGIGEQVNPDRKIWIDDAQHQHRDRDVDVAHRHVDIDMSTNMTSTYDIPEHTPTHPRQAPLRIRNGACLGCVGVCSGVVKHDIPNRDMSMRIVMLRCACASQHHDAHRHVTIRDVMFDDP